MVGFPGPVELRGVPDGAPRRARKAATHPALAASVREAHQRIRDFAPRLVVLMAVRNDALTVRRAVESALSQRGIEGKWMLVLLDDGSTDGSLDQALSVAAGAPVLAVRAEHLGVVASRNRLLRLVRHAPARRPISIRLDADDAFAEDCSVARLDTALRRSHFSLRCGLREAPEAVLAGNSQVRDGRVIGWNIPGADLLDRRRLLERLEGMSGGDFAAELPSCNLVLGPAVDVLYPWVMSAEDHWLTVDVLLHSPRYRLGIQADLLHTAYTLGGRSTTDNHRRRAYHDSRCSLFAWAARRVARARV